MRAFIAIDANDAIKAECKRAQDTLRYTGADISWTAPQNIHMTMKFLGEIDDAMVVKVKAALDKVAAQYKPFQISLFKIGAFPKLDFPRVVWAGIDQNCSVVEEIALKVDNECSALGFDKEARPFTSHLTIGRVKSPKNKDKLREKILAMELPLVTSDIESIKLYQSTLTPNGSIYTPIYKACLK